MTTATRQRPLGPSLKHVGISGSIHCGQSTSQGPIRSRGQAPDNPRTLVAQFPFTRSQASPILHIVVLGQNCTLLRAIATILTKITRLPATLGYHDMSLSSLPNEVILIISEKLETEREIFSLLRTNKRFYRLLRPGTRYQINKWWHSTKQLSMRKEEEGGMARELSK